MYQKTLQDMFTIVQVICLPYSLFLIVDVARWSKGMTLSLAAKGPGLKSRAIPMFYNVLLDIFQSFIFVVVLYVFKL